MYIIDLVLLASIPINTALSITGYYIVYVKGIKKQPIKVKPNIVWILLALLSATPFTLRKIISSHSIRGIVQVLFILSVALTGFALYQAYRYFNKQKGSGAKNSDTVKKVVEIALAATLFGYLGFFAVRYDIIGTTKGDLYISETIPVYNEDGTIKHDRHGNVVYDTYYDYEIIPGTLDGDNALYLFLLYAQMLVR